MDRTEALTRLRQVENRKLRECLTLGTLDRTQKAWLCAYFKCADFKWERRCIEVSPGEHVFVVQESQFNTSLRRALFGSEIVSESAGTLSLGFKEKDLLRWALGQYATLTLSAEGLQRARELGLCEQDKSAAASQTWARRLGIPSGANWKDVCITAAPGALLVSYKDKAPIVEAWAHLGYADETRRERVLLQAFQWGRTQEASKNTISLLRRRLIEVSGIAEDPLPSIGKGMYERAFEMNAPKSNWGGASQDSAVDFSESDGFQIRTGPRR